MRNYKEEVARRVEWIRSIIESAGANGVIFGNSGGKDCVLVGILCKMACDNTIGVITPIETKRNYGEDKEHAIIFAKQFNIETRIVDLTVAKQAIVGAVDTALSETAISNIAPRLRMTAWRLIAQAENLLYAGTSNKSELHMGYFTKYGDNAYDFNPIADLTVTEVYEFLRYLDAPACIIDKPPSAGLIDGQTDEAEMGVTYAAIDAYLRGEEISSNDRKIIERYHKYAQHKLNPPYMYNDKQS